MGEEILALLREAASTLVNSPVAAQAEADVKAVEETLAKHAAAAADEVKNWLIARLHPLFGSPAEAAQATSDTPPVA
jgi:hypothetical protein